ncbi:MAG: hypothetical protein U1F77_05315 [Kiritimatiellia bacterium]
MRYAATLAYLLGIAAVCTVISGAAWLLESALALPAPALSMAVSAVVFAVLLPFFSTRFHLNDDWKDLVVYLRRRFSARAPGVDL